MDTKILVIDVAAEKGGALSVLADFYQEVSAGERKNVKWIFVLSTPDLLKKKHIQILKFPWIKKSWLHRFFFEMFVAPRLVRRYQPDCIFSLQNIIVPFTKREQILYVHQPLPFVPYRFSFRENRELWVYQNIVGRFIFRSLKKAKKVIVQTGWMKQAIIEKLGIDEGRIRVVPPEIRLEVKEFFQPNRNTLSTFFYPASGSAYKNHKIIIEACLRLKKTAGTEYKILFTLRGDENPYIAQLKKIVSVNGLPVEFAGPLPREEVFRWYAKSVLLFPSYVETFGLPLLESKMHGGMILAADVPFAREVLGDYPNARYFPCFDSGALADLILDMASGKIPYVRESRLEKIARTNTLAEEILPRGKRGIPAETVQADIPL